MFYTEMLKYRYNDMDTAVEVGMDEVGRGCLFGRLYVGAVVLPIDKDDLFDHGANLKMINDSKKLTKRKREILYDYVKEIALDWTTEFAESTEIDEVNVLQADLNAMARALGKLTIEPERVLIDGDRNLPLHLQKPDVDYHIITQGDANYLSIACASIVAKVEHDAWIKDICAEDPSLDTKYGLLSNMGYGTATHLKGIKEHGVVANHRRSFKPVALAVSGTT